MRAKFLVGLMLLIGIAHADTLTLLQRPAPPPARWTCAGTGFVKALPKGICELRVFSGVRYAQPARYQYTVTWNTNGTINGALNFFCYSKAHFGPDKSGCKYMVDYSDTNVVVTINGYPLWYVSSNYAGAELVNAQTDAWLWTP